MHCNSSVCHRHDNRYNDCNNDDYHQDNSNDDAHNGKGELWRRGERDSETETLKQVSWQPHKQKAWKLCHWQGIAQLLIYSMDAYYTVSHSDVIRMWWAFNDECTRQVKLTDLSISAGVWHSCPDSVCPTLHVVGSSVHIVLNAVNGLSLGEGGGGEGWSKPIHLCVQSHVCNPAIPHACMH